MEPKAKLGAIAYNESHQSERWGAGGASIVMGTRTHQLTSWSHAGCGPAMWHLTWSSDDRALKGCILPFRRTIRLPAADASGNLSTRTRSHAPAPDPIPSRPGLRSRPPRPCVALLHALLTPRTKGVRKPALPATAYRRTKRVQTKIPNYQLSPLRLLSPPCPL